MSIFHTQYESDGNLVLFECTECGERRFSLGSLHAHIESHRGYTRFNISLPFTKTSPGKFEELMKRTKIRRVTETEKIGLSEVDGL